MKKLSKRAAPERARIDISVDKYRWISYDGKRLNFETIMAHFSNDRADLIQFLRDHAPEQHSPRGFYGGNINTAWELNKVMDLLVVAGFPRERLKGNIKFFVTICGSAAPDTNPHPATHEIDWKKCRGFDTRAEANKAAQSRFAYYNAWCIEGKKRTNVVTLKLYDKDGNVTEEKSN